ENLFRAFNGEEAGFELVALSPDQQPMPMRVKWSLNRIETRYHWYQLYGNWNWERSTRRKSIATGEALLGETPVLLSTPTDWGRYELVVERLDGDYVEAALDFYAGWYAPADASATPDRLEMSLDADSYQPGDTAQLRLVPQSAGTALISVLSNQVIERHAVEVEAGEVLVDVQAAGTLRWDAPADPLLPWDLGRGLLTEAVVGRTGDGMLFEGDRV
ncbi:MAG: alpha-2-macroglobulin family protein, partial [Sulfitobacter sp.]|nr:alpha-2-macroglobulin family protein [Sulfitobacter sp.]